MVPLAVVTATVMLAGWFPLSALIHQQGQLDATRAQLRVVQQQEQNLKNQSRVIDTTAAAIELAREQYQLVAPGQSLIQVLPGNAAGRVSLNSVDPGLQPLVAPSSGAPYIAARPTSHGRTDNFLTRLVRTLEFWR